MTIPAIYIPLFFFFFFRGIINLNSPTQPSSKSPPHCAWRGLLGAQALSLVGSARDPRPTYPRARIRRERFGFSCCFSRLLPNSPLAPTPSIDRSTSCHLPPFPFHSTREASHLLPLERLSVIVSERPLFFFSCPFSSLGLVIAPDAFVSFPCDTGKTQTFTKHTQEESHRSNDPTHLAALPSSFASHRIASDGSRRDISPSRPH